MSTSCISVSNDGDNLLNKELVDSDDKVFVYHQEDNTGITESQVNLNYSDSLNETKEEEPEMLENSNNKVLII